MLENQVVNLLKEIDLDTPKAKCRRKRRKERVSYYKFKREDLFSDLFYHAKDKNLDYTEQDMKNFVEVFESFIKKYQMKALNENISYRIPFLGDLLKIEFYDSRKVRNPAYGTTFICEKKTAVEFKSKRKTKTNLEIDNE